MRIILLVFVGLITLGLTPDQEKTCPKACILAENLRGNVIYLGFYHPIYIQTEGWEEKDVAIEVLGAEYNLKAGNQLEILATHPGFITINISNKTTLETKAFQFRGKRQPDPMVGLGRNRGGEIGSGEFKAQRGLIANVMNMDVTGWCSIESYTLQRIPKKDTIQSYQGNSPHFEGAVKKAILAAKPGDAYLFTNVYATCLGDKQAREISSLCFTIK